MTCYSAKTIMNFILFPIIMLFKNHGAFIIIYQQLTSEPTTNINNATSISYNRRACYLLTIKYHNLSNDFFFIICSILTYEMA